MRNVIALTLAAAAMLACLMPAFAERARTSQATQQRRSYEQCHSLALQRGLTVNRRDRWQMDEFIAGCLSGRIR